jgi:ribosomal protein S18 acetylase RimI-like enzyme
MRRDLNDLPRTDAWPEGIRLERFTHAMARDAHALMTAAYADGGGRMPAFEAWWRALSQDGEYASELCFPVRDQSGQLAAFAQCWTSGFVKDFAVHPDWQRRGLGRALLLHVFQVFRMRGAIAVSLKVEADNARALQFYRNLGLSPAA